MNQKYKIIFIGTPEIAAETLQELINSEIYKPVLVITQKDKPVGRKQIITPSPVKVLAEKNNIEVFQPENLGDESVISKIKGLSPDIIIVVAYGKLIPIEIINIPQKGILNIHTSLLPRHRGASPVHHAILAGDKEAGVTIMKIDEKMDHGPIVAQEKIIISENETYETLYRKLSELGAKLLIKTLPLWFEGKIKEKEQDHSKATFTKIIKKNDGKITEENTALEVYRMFRAFMLWPGVHFEIKTKNSKLLKVKITDMSLVGCELSNKKLLEVFLNVNKELILNTKEGCVKLLQVQPESKNKITGKEFFSGYLK